MTDDDIRMLAKCIREVAMRTRTVYDDSSRGHPVWNEMPAEMREWLERMTAPPAARS